MNQFIVWVLSYFTCGILNAGLFLVMGYVYTVVYLDWSKRSKFLHRCSQVKYSEKMIIMWIVPKLIYKAKSSPCIICSGDVKYATTEVKAGNGLFVVRERGISSLVVQWGRVSRLHGCVFPRNLSLQSSCGCELPNNSFHHWAVFSVFICPAATLPLDGPFLDEALQSNVTLSCCVTLLLHTCTKPSW